MITKIKKIIAYIFAEEDELSLEHRLLLSSIVIGSMTSIVGSIVNLFLTTSLTAVIIPFILSSILLVVYYFIRVKKIIKPLIIPIIIIAILGIAVIWIFNGGMDSSNILPAIVILVLSLTIVSDKGKIYVLLFYLFVILGVYLIELNHPELITRFSSKEERWLDEFITVIYTAIFLFFIVKYLHKSYQTEKEKVEESGKKLLKLNAEKDKFISILGHDLRGPLSGILMFLEYFEKNIDKYDKTAIKSKISLLNSSGKEVYNMLEDILTWGKAQTTNFPFNPEYVNFVQLGSIVIKKLNLTALNKNIEIIPVFTKELKVWADKEIVIIILRNLITNAIKFTPKGGFIKIHVVTEEKEHMICIEDNGIGIKPQKLESLFDISQIQSTLGTEREKGTGMGLVLCKEFVEKHKGRIWVESKLGKGSKFYFTLPFNEKKV